MKITITEYSDTSRYDGRIWLLWKTSGR